MDKSNLIGNIIELPENIKKENISEIDYLENIGYFKNDMFVNFDSIYTALKKNPSKFNDWRIFSDDKRTDKGWFLRRFIFNTYEVGYYPSGYPTSRFINKIKACAYFIIKELDEIKRIRSGQHIDSGE